MIEERKDAESGVEEITKEEFKEFFEARSYEDRLRILQAHSAKNTRRIEIGRAARINAKTEEEIEAEMLELNRRFSEFLHTKGIAAKFKLAFRDIGESARRQREEDRANFEAIRAKSIEENRDFVEFLHAKGFKAKLRVVIENVKKGAKQAPARTAAQIARARACAERDTYCAPAGVMRELSAEQLADEFNLFLKSKGLDREYTVVIK